MSKGRVTLILGGARSGKSSFAENMARQSDLPVTYVATAEIRDEEMKKRVEIHRQRRPEKWKTWEGSPEQLVKDVKELKGYLLLDCLTMWLTRLMLEDDRSEKATQVEWQKREDEIIAMLEKMCKSVTENTHLVIVSNEVGLSLVPPYKMGRRFRDMQGRANQVVAQYAKDVVLVVAGCPVYVKK